MTKIKICGITNKIDAVFAADLGINILGFVFYKKSKRYVDPMTVEDIVNELPPSMGVAGVFVDEDEKKVREIAENASLNILQFHGNETPEYCAKFKGDFKVIKAFSINDKNDLKKINGYDTDFYLFDTYRAGCIGGTGEVFDWKILKDFEILKPVILSGGLDPANVASAIREVAPYGVDVSSGIERSPGKKDHELMKRFVESVRKAD